MCPCLLKRLGAKSCTAAAATSGTNACRSCDRASSWSDDANHCKKTSRRRSPQSFPIMPPPWPLRFRSSASQGAGDPATQRCKRDPTCAGTFTAQVDLKVVQSCKRLGRIGGLGVLGPREQEDTKSVSPEGLGEILSLPSSDRRALQYPGRRTSEGHEGAKRGLRGESCTCSYRRTTLLLVSMEVYSSFVQAFSNVCHRYFTVLTPCSFLWGFQLASCRLAACRLSIGRAATSTQ